MWKKIIYIVKKWLTFTFYPIFFLSLKLKMTLLKNKSILMGHKYNKIVLPVCVCVYIYIYIYIYTHTHSIDHFLNYFQNGLLAYC